MHRLTLLPLSILVLALLAAPADLSARSASIDPDGEPTATTTSCELEESCGDRGAATDPDGSPSPSTYRAPAPEGQSDALDPDRGARRSGAGFPVDLWFSWLRTVLPV